MTNIEQKALELVNEAARERGYTVQESTRKLSVYVEALCRAIEQHEAFKREVSDAVEVCQSCGGDGWDGTAYVGQFKCGQCNGTGVVKQSLTVELVSNPDELAAAIEAREWK